MVRPMGSNELRSKWLAEALERTGKTQAGLARALGITPPQVNRTVKGTRRLTAAELPLAERYLGERAPDRVGAFADGATPSLSDFASVPLHDLRVALQPGQTLEDGIPLRYLLFDRHWLERVGTDPSSLVAFEYGDEQMLVDRARTNPRQEGTYILRIDDVLLCRSVSTHPVKKTLTVRSDDPAQPVYDDVSPDDLDVVGRVVWIARTIG